MSDFSIRDAFRDAVPDLGLQQRGELVALLLDRLGGEVEISREEAQAARRPGQVLFFINETPDGWIIKRPTEVPS